MGLRQLLALLAAGFAAAGNADNADSFIPTLESARANGPQIFNAVYNAMREFGSAVHHNGMSIFPAVIPEGILLYHGTHTREIPEGMEWLAFEIEHAQNFARPRPPRRPHPPQKDSPRDTEELRRSLQDATPLELAIALQGSGWPPPMPPVTSGEGYLHTYQASRPLKALYIDGMAAGKTDMGTLDTQDLLLTNNRNRTGWGEMERAKDLCALAKDWGIDGLIRMEPGFEMIYCDFTEGLRLLSTRALPEQDDPGSMDDVNIMMFQWASAAAQRYKGIGSSRVLLDYSSMVSAFFYPLNLTNPDPERPELPRLSQATDAELGVMREHIANISLKFEALPGNSVDWQGVTDMVVARLGDRLPLLATTDSLKVFQHEINNLLNVYIEYAENDEGFAAARRRCAEYYLLPATPRTSEDRLIQTGIESTTATICTALFEARKIVVEDSEADESSLKAGKDIISGLMDVLQWSKWKECGPCRSNEVCFIAMWPFGNVEDHFHPSCLNVSTLGGRRSYWRMPDSPPAHNRSLGPRGGLVDQRY